MKDEFLTAEEVKMQAVAILEDIIQFWQPAHSDDILSEFKDRLNGV